MSDSAPPTGPTAPTGPTGEPGPAAPLDDVAVAALVAEAASKSSLLWIRPGDSPEPGRAWPAWHIWRDGAAYVVSGPGEQQLPPLRGVVELVLRSKDTWARLVTLRAQAEPVPADDPGWVDLATALKADRLNAPDPDGLLDRWRADCVITRITPEPGFVEGPGEYIGESDAAPPVPTDAVTMTWQPWHARGRRGARRNTRRT